MSEKRTVVYAERRCSWCQALFRPTNSKQKTCTWRCRFQAVQAPFTTNSSCWEWPQSRNKKTGYGQFHTEGEAQRNQSAHRLSFLLNRGDIPAGMYVLHKCDNRGCFNPEHLFLGTHEENLADMRAKGRERLPLRRRGDVHPNAKLRSADVKDIRASNEPDAVLAARYGVSKTAINLARRGFTWSAE